MSHDIVYRRQFIKVNEEYIPMIESGSNNCYEWNNRKRARDWGKHSFYLKNKLSISIEDLSKAMDDDLASYVERYKNEASAEEINKRWSYYTAVHLLSSSKTSFSQFKSFYINACKKALTVEELNAKGISPIISVYYYKEEDITNKGKEVWKSLPITTTEQLVSEWAKWTEYYKGVSSVYLGYDDWEMDNYFEKEKRARKLAKRAKPYTETNEYYVLLSSSDKTYFVKNTRRGYRYNHTPIFGKKFLTYKQANTFHKRMKNKDRFEIMTIVSEYPVSVR